MTANRGARTLAVSSLFSTLVSPFYLPTTRMENESGTIGPRPARPPEEAPAARHTLRQSVKMWPVLPSSVNVFALGIVFTVCSTVKLAGLSSLTTVSVPSPCELKASVAESPEPAAFGLLLAGLGGLFVLRRRI